MAKIRERDVPSQPSTTSALWTSRTLTIAAPANVGDFCFLDTTAATFAVAAPSPAVAGTRWGVKWIAGAVAPTLTGTFNGTPTFTAVNQVMQFISNGTAWYQAERPALSELPDYPALTDARYQPIGTSSAVPLAGGTMTGELVAPDFKASGLTGAVAASRYVGATAAGPPTSGTFAVGDVVISQAGRIWICTTAGTPGTWEALVNGSERGWSLPTGALAQTVDRAGSSSDIAALTSARLYLAGIYLRAGQIVANITFVSGGTVLNTGSNQWFALYSAARAKLGVTSDDTSTAWTANTAKTLAMAAPYTVPTSGLYYLGICVVASTPPSLTCVSARNAIAGLAPILGGNSTSTLTNPASAPDPAAAITSTGNLPYAYVS